MSLGPFLCPLGVLTKASDEEIVYEVKASGSSLFEYWVHYWSLSTLILNTHHLASPVYQILCCLLTQSLLCLSSNESHTYSEIAPAQEETDCAKLPSDCRHLTSQVLQ